MIAKKMSRRLADLYEADETAWLERTARLIKRRLYEDVDYRNLAEYLTDMANRDRKEVKSRLVQLLVHLLKWEHQPNRRTRSWKSTMLDQHYELQDDLLTSKTLKNHAEQVLDQAYARAVKLASSQTGLPEKKFPAACPYTIEELSSETLESLLIRGDRGKRSRSRGNHHDR